MNNSQNSESVPTTIDPETGFQETKFYPFAFDAERKLMFIQRLVANGLGVQNTCNELGLSYHTFIKHFNNDPAFKDAVQQARRDYADSLDAVSKRNAMNPKSVIERIFQLKSLFPSRYAENKGESSTAITINFDGMKRFVEEKKIASNIVEGEIVPPSGNGESCAA